ncbi:beta-hexosaminidase [Roseibium sp. TrichSKD4]|uniref:beta-N-acetylhexosaminidase n=1 Tax=Roseibium sp. TrichSKD4 TaxID=744980 RepID=UPI0001E572F5|nr:beta-N-acetylhexosaminidase [Roseibium sp. TrichSKD4]EFO29760.1 beta-hexosaminidase [Roseibium sp. TrichSKD4]
MTKAFISGCAAHALSDEEIAFFKAEDPWGLILFRRNIETPEQVRALTQAFRDAVGRADAPVLIDQEGGRVQRLRPPHWPSFPPQKLFGDLYQSDPGRARDAAKLGSRLIAHELRGVGITVDCLPCLDVSFPETVDAIGDRSLSADPNVVADLGRSVADGLLEGGVLPVAKHIPGHGRAQVDSHLDLPHIAASAGELAEVDFKPFLALADLPFGMTAHLLYQDLDHDTPATQSQKIIQDVIRKTIGFDGCLLSDDISMKALGGDMLDRARKTFAAGCDIVLHCNGEMQEMQTVAAAAPKLEGRSAERCSAALSMLGPVLEDFDRDAERARFDQLVSPVIA